MPRIPAFCCGALIAPKTVLQRFGTEGNVMKQQDSSALPFLVAGLMFCATFLTMPAWAGNEGGGGGSSVTCVGRSGPELTDLYELRTERPELTARLDQLRKMNEQEALEYVSSQLAAFLNTGISGESAAVTRKRTQELLDQVYHSPRFGTPADPKDSGRLVLQPGCVENRVAVNSGFDVYTHPYFGTNNVTVVEPRWQELTPFDRYGLIVHEACYTITEGRVSIDSMDPLLKIPKVSQDVRKVVASILIGDAPKTLTLPFKTAQKMDCWAGTADVRREHSEWDRIGFDIFPTPAGYHGPTMLELTNMWGITVYIPNLARTDLDFQSLQLDGSKLLAIGRNAGGATRPFAVSELKVPSSWGLTRTYVSFHPVQRPGVDSAPVLFMKVVRMDKDSEGKSSPTTLMDGVVNCNQPAHPRPRSSSGFTIGEPVIYKDNVVGLKGTIKDVEPGGGVVIDFGNDWTNIFYSRQPTARNLRAYHHVDSLVVRNFVYYPLFTLKLGESVIYKDSVNWLRGKVEDLTEDGLALVDFGDSVKNRIYRQYIRASQYLTPAEDQNGQH
jgi:hypothetical protein